jgi:hypothetical protein
MQGVAGRGEMPMGPMPGGMPGGMPGMGLGGRHGFGRGMGPSDFRPYPGMPGGGVYVPDPEMERLLRQDMQLGSEAEGLAGKYHEAAKEDRAEIKQQLVETLEKQFEVRQQRRGLELKMMENQLKRLRELVDRRAKTKKELVQKRVADMIGPEEPGVEF